MKSERHYKAYLERMPESQEKDYIVNRIISQIEWLDKRSNEKQERFKIYSIGAIVLNACIPTAVFLAGYCSGIQLLVIVFSSMAGVFGAIAALCGYKDLWIQYRTTCETLKSKLHRFFLQVGEFDGSDDSERFKRLVAESEKYLTKDLEDWGSRVYNYANERE